MVAVEMPESFKSQAAGPSADPLSPALDQASSVVAKLKPMEPGGVKVEDLLQTASAYAAQAIQSLISQSDGDTQRLRGLFYNYVELAYRLEIHYLFPNLGDYERGLLVALCSARSAIMVGLRNSAHWRTVDQRKDHESVLLRLKEQYIHQRAEVISRNVKSRLTSLQQQLLNREFLTIPFDEHTSFTLRPGAAAA